MTDSIAITPGGVKRAPELVAVPRDTLLDIADVIGGMFPETAQRILDLPVSLRRDRGMRVVNITDAAVTTRTVTYPREYIEQLPDPMTVIEQAVRDTIHGGSTWAEETRAAVIGNIRAALEGATQ